MNILNDFAGLPGSGGVMAVDRRAVGLTVDKTIGGAEVNKDSVIKGEGGGGAPVEDEAGRNWGLGIGDWGHVPVRVLGIIG